LRAEERHYLMNCYRCLPQGCTSPGRQVSLATKFLMLAPKDFGSWVWNLLPVTILAPGI